MNKQQAEQMVRNYMVELLGEKKGMDLPFIFTEDSGGIYFDEQGKVLLFPVKLVKNNDQDKIFAFLAHEFGHQDGEVNPVINTIGIFLEKIEAVLQFFANFYTLIFDKNFKQEEMDADEKAVIFLKKAKKDPQILIDKLLTKHLLETENQTGILAYLKKQSLKQRIKNVQKIIG